MHSLIQKLGVNRQPLAQLKSPCVCAFFQLMKMRPWTFWIDKIRRQRRDPAPVVDACVEKFFIIRIGKIWRCLKVYIRYEQSRESNGPQHFAAAWLRPTAHGNLGLRTEILNDDFLDVTVALVQVANRQQCIHAIFWGLADADENAGR